MEKYKHIVDNRLNCYGEIDDVKKVIRINKKKNKKAGKGELINTITHEECHLQHPRMSEKGIKKLTIKMVEKMSRKEKKKYYNLYNKKCK